MKRVLKYYSIFICGAAMLLATQMNAQTEGASINATGAAPDPSAIFDVSSSTKGTLIPRMTTVERNAIANPAIGLQVFNTTTNCLNIWIGSTWKQICGDCDFNSPVVGNNGPICEGSTLNLTATSISGATYQWSGPNGFTSTLQNPTIPNATSAASGTYSVAATLNGCTSQLQNTVATVNATPVTPAAGNDGPVCAGSSLNLNAVTINGASYSWSGPNGYSAVVQNPLVSNNIQLANAGVYNVVASVNGCASSAGSTTVVVNALPATTFSPTGATTNVAKTFVPTVSGAVYNWTFTGGSPSSSTSENPSASWTTAGSYNVSLQVTLANGCTATGTTSVTVLNPTVVTFNNSSTGRFGSIQQFTAPSTGLYTIEAFGAQGGGYCSNIGGAGARMRGDFTLTAGTVLDILVGQAAETDFGGGGGGSFVVSAGTPLIIAGGGGGAGCNGPGLPGNTATGGSSGSGGAQGTGGESGGGGGGAAGYGGAGGGGFCGDGGNAGRDYCSGGSGGNGCVNGNNSSCAVCTDTKGMSYQNGGAGGTASCYPSQGEGGYGGGGASIHGNACGGGGGGYSGGGGGGYAGTHGYGGGGGSYNTGTNQSNTPGSNTGQGKVTITY